MIIMPICSRYPKELIHYHKQLKKNCFKKLKDNVWENKTKWKLVLKADCNYEFKILLACLRGWVRFAEQKARKKRMLEDVVNLHSKKLKRLYFAVLKNRVQPKWQLRKIFRHELELRAKRRIWNVWERFTKKSLRMKEITLLTFKMRQFNLIRRILDTWHGNYNLRKIHEKNLFIAVRFYSVTLQRRAFRSWRGYVNYRSRKRDFIMDCLRRVDHKFKERIFGKLMNYTVQRKLYRKHVQCVTSFYENYLLKNVLSKWSERYDELMENRMSSALIVAANHYHSKLVSKAFMKLRIWAAEGKRMLASAEAFVKASTIVKMRYCIELWQKSYQDRMLLKALIQKADDWRTCQLRLIYIEKMRSALARRMEEEEVMARFGSLYTEGLKCKLFRAWTYYIDRRRRKKDAMDAAVRHHQIRVLDAATQKWKTYIAQRSMKLRMVSFYQKKLLSKVLMAWRCKYVTKQYFDKLVQEMENKQRTKILQMTFSVLNNMRKESAEKVRTFVSSKNTRMKLKAIQHWRRYNEFKKSSQILQSRNRSRLNDIIILEVLLTWRTKALIRKSFKKQLLCVKRNQEMRIIKKYLSLWSQFIWKYRKIRENSLVFQEIRRKMIVRDSLQNLNSAWKEIIVIRSKMDLAARANREILIRRYLKKWLGYVNWKKEKLKDCSAYESSDKCHSRCRGSDQFKRRQPMIPTYLRKELLFALYNDDFSSSISSANTHIISSPVNERLPVIK